MKIIRISASNENWLSKKKPKKKRREDVNGDRKIAELRKDLEAVDCAPTEKD